MPPKPQTQETGRKQPTIIPYLQESLDLMAKLFTYGLVLSGGGMALHSLGRLLPSFLGVAAAATATPLVGEAIVSNTAPLTSVLGGVRTALTTNHNNNLALFSELNDNTGAFQIFSASSNSSNNFSPNNLINYLPSGSLPAIAFNGYDYTAAWIKTSGTVSTVSYGYINQAGVWDYNAVDYPGTASLQSATNVALVASAPLSFTLGIEAPQTITLGTTQFAQKRLYIRTFTNNVASAAERSFTQDSYIQVAPSGVNYFIYQGQVLIQDVNNIYSIFAFSYLFSSNYANPTLTNEIRYTLNPQTATNSQGTSLTAANFPPANWVITSNHAINMPSFNNTKAVSFLARSTSAVANSNGDYTFNIYIQLLNNVMGLSGAPIAIPIPTSNTLNGLALTDNKPTLVPAPFGCGLFFSGNVTNPQAYFVGVNMTTATPTLMNVVPMFPSTVPQLFGVGVVTDDGNLVTYYLKTTNLESQWASVYRTPGLNIVCAPNTAYTQDKVCTLQFALSFPIDTTSTNTVTTLTISIPSNMGTISISNSTLLGTATILNQTPTQITLQTNSTTLLNSLIDMNSNGIIQYTPAQYASNTVPFTLTATAGPYSKTLTFNLPGIPVAYTPTVTADVSIEQGQLLPVTSTVPQGNQTLFAFLGCNAINANCTITVNNLQNIEFRRAHNTNQTLTQQNYLLQSDAIQTVAPPTTSPSVSFFTNLVAANSFTPQDITNGVVWIRQTGASNKHFVCDLTVTDSQGLSQTLTYTGNVILDPGAQLTLPTTWPIINEGQPVYFTSQYFNAAEPGLFPGDPATPPDQLTYQFFSPEGLTLYKNGVPIDFNNLQCTQADINPGNVISAQPNSNLGPLDARSFSYYVINANGIASKTVFVLMPINPTPEFDQALTLTYTQKNTFATITPQQLLVQSPNAATDLVITIEQMKDCQVKVAGTPLSQGGIFTQDNINQDKLSGSFGDNPVLTLKVTDQFGASSTYNVPLKYQPPAPNLQNGPLTPAQIGTEIIIPVFAAILSLAKIYLMIRERIRKKDERWSKVPLAMPLCKALSLTGVEDFDDPTSGALYKEAIESITTQLLLSQGVRVDLENCESIAKLTKQYLESEEGQDYLNFIQPSREGWFAFLHAAKDILERLTLTGLQPFKQLRNSKVKTGAHLIAAAIRPLYDQAIKDAKEDAEPKKQNAAPKKDYETFDKTGGSNKKGKIMELTSV